MTILSSNSNSNLEESDTLGSRSTPRWLSRCWDRSYFAGGGVDDMARFTPAVVTYIFSVEDAQANTVA